MLSHTRINEDVEPFGDHFLFNASVQSHGKKLDTRKVEAPAVNDTMGSPATQSGTEKSVDRRDEDKRVDDDEPDEW